MIKANDPGLKSWVDVTADSDFPIQNLPFGVFDPGDGPRIGVAIGEKVLDLRFLAMNGHLNDTGIDLEALLQPTLNAFAAQGRTASRAVRNRVSILLSDDNPELRDNAEDRAAALHARADVTMCMPVQVGDYTDFYSSIDHATNVGTMFRDPNNALLPNWKHIPVGYHGRASSIILSGTDFHRPKGQTRPDAEKPPVYGPCRLLDFELEMAFIVGKPTALGETVSAANAEDHIFGMVIFNDSTGLT
ncbi:MAG: fumarylacetoacetate hydrolase family protein [Bacteroidota bacterium]